MGYCYDHEGKLCCDFCGKSGGVRRKKCPHGWCQPVAICPVCRKDKEKMAKESAAHGDCERLSNEAKARDAKVQALLDQDRFIRASALGVHGPDGTELVHVIFRNKDNIVRGFYMESKVYAGIPLSAPATIEDYQSLGNLLPAPTEFQYGS